MYKSNELKTDLEGFLEDLTKNGSFSPRLSKENLTEQVKPRIEEFFAHYNNKFYNQQRISEVKTNVLEGVFEYVKVSSEYNKELGQIMLAYSSVKYGLGGLAGFLGVKLTGGIFAGVVLFMLVSSFVGRKISITKEYIELKKKKELLFNNFLT